jgi:hypothetical protein
MGALVQQSPGASTAIEEPAVADPYYDELNRLFQLYRLANLNARYYGCRVEKYEKWNRLALVSGALLSTAALALILGVEQNQTWARTVAAICAGLAAVISGAIPLMGWTEKVHDLRNLRFAYSQLFGQIEFAITEIKRAGFVSPEHVGLSRMVHEGFMRVEAMDELEPDQKLIDREDEKVRKSFPDTYLWTNL